MGNNLIVKKAIVKDIRGEQFSANSIGIINNKPYFGGLPLKQLVKNEDGRSDYYFDIILTTNLNCGTIALRYKDAEFINSLIK